MSNRQQIFDALSEMYETRSGDCYELKQSEDRGVYMTTTRAVGKGEVVLIEAPLALMPIHDRREFMQRPDIAAMNQRLNVFSARYGHLEGADKYPPEAQAVMNQREELRAEEYLLTSPNVDKIWKLHDAHRCAKIGNLVMIDGLLSENGRPLNGKKGRVIGEDSRDNHRLEVEIDCGSHEQRVSKSVRQKNLKTLGGIIRTNSFVFGDLHSALFGTLSRANHACGESANITKADYAGRAYVVAKRDIRAGEEILIDYLVGDPVDEHRVPLLQLKYNFECQCPEHHNAYDDVD